MCGRYTLAKGEKILEVVQNVTIREDLREVGTLWEGRWNIAPTQQVLAVANRTVAGNGFAVEAMRWGLVPHWAKDLTIGSKMINARAETLDQKPAFRESLARRRCVIPADGFYEWKNIAGPPARKIPMYVHLKSGRAFGFAGLWDVWRDEGGREVTTCTIVTTRANRPLSDIHERMPVILAADAVKEWLDPRERKADEMLRSLRTLTEGEMEVYAVGRGVNSARSQGPELARRVEEGEEPPPGARPAASEPRGRRGGEPRESPEQGRLF